MHLPWTAAIVGFGMSRQRRYMRRVDLGLSGDQALGAGLVKAPPHPDDREVFDLLALVSSQVVTGGEVGIGSGDDDDLDLVVVRRRVAGRRRGRTSSAGSARCAHRRGPCTTRATPGAGDS